MKRKVVALRRVNPLRIALAYGCIGCLWILLSGISNLHSLTLNTYMVRGLGLVLATTALVYWYLKSGSDATLPVHLAFHHGPFGIATFGGGGDIESCSPVFAQMLGNRGAAFLTELWDRLPRSDSSEARQFEHTVETDAGVKRHIKVTFIQVGERRETSGCVCFVEDLTHQRELESELSELEASLREVQKMEILGQVAGGAAHDFNNHLQILNGYAHLLAEEQDAEARKELFDEMSRSIEQAEALSNKLLMFARRHASRFEAVDLRDVCREAVDFIAAAFPHEISLNIDICDEPLMVDADKDEVGRVIANLCLNARDAIDGAGKVMLTVSRFTSADSTSDLAPGAYARIEVADTGCGMDASTMDQIFDPFFTTKGERGTGLGLATSHGIVKQHKGAIRVASYPARGTTFNVYLPLVDGADMSLVLNNDHSRAMVLLAEKDPEILALTSRLLSHSGFNVMGTRGIRETRALFDSHLERIDVVVIDLDSMYGAEIYDYIRARRPGMPIIFSSRYFSDEPRRVPGDVLRIGSPTSPDVLKAAIEIALRSEPGLLRTGTQ